MKVSFIRLIKVRISCVCAHALFGHERVIYEAHESQNIICIRTCIIHSWESFVMEVRISKSVPHDSYTSFLLLAWFKRGNNISRQRNTNSFSTRGSASDSQRSRNRFRTTTQEPEPQEPFVRTRQRPSPTRTQDSTPSRTRTRGRFRTQDTTTTTREPFRTAEGGSPVDAGQRVRGGTRFRDARPQTDTDRSTRVRVRYTEATVSSLYIYIDIYL